MTRTSVGATRTKTYDWADRLREWAEGREATLDFKGCEVPTPIQNLLSQTVEDFQREIREINEANGWYDDDRAFGDDVALLHSEVSEMYEAYRSHGLDDMTEKQCTKHDHSHPLVPGQLLGNLCKPEGVASEVADVFIRLLDTCERQGIDLRFETMRKLAYNRTRGYRHGGKRV